MRERWGTFSVIDHTKSSAFIPEILLYDRLVIPVPSHEEAKEVWTERGWEPDLLEKRLKILDNIAVKTRWDERLQKKYQERMQALKFDVGNVVNEAQNAVPYQMTRAILAQEPAALPQGVSKVTVVAAYQSERDFKNDFKIKDKVDEEAELGMLLGHKIAVPQIDSDNEDFLKKAVDLASTEDFKKKRRDLYEWQENIIREKIDSYKAVEEMDKLIAEYNKRVEKAWEKVYFKLAITLGQVAIGVFASAALGNPLAVGSAFLAVAGFAYSDRKPEIKAGEELKPAAMFHDVKTSLGWKIN